jgi:hypothetical protein
MMNGVRKIVIAAGARNANRLKIAFRPTRTPYSLSGIISERACRSGTLSVDSVFVTSECRRKFSTFQ